MRGIRRNKETEPADLDLAPMLSMIVALIPILLLSFSFFHMTTLEAALPQPSKAKSSSQKKGWKIELFVKKGKRLQILAKKGGNRILTKNLASKNGKFDLKRLKKEILKLKKRAPEHHKLELHVKADVPYESLVKIMDEVRKEKDQWLFPNVIFADLFKG